MILLLLYNNNINNIYIYLYDHFILIGKLMGNPETDGGNALFSGNRIHNMISLHWDHLTPVHQPKTQKGTYFSAAKVVYTYIDNSGDYGWLWLTIYIIYTKHFSGAIYTYRL